MSMLISCNSLYTAAVDLGFSFCWEVSFETGLMLWLHACLSRQQRQFETILPAALKAVHS